MLSREKLEAYLEKEDIEYHLDEEDPDRILVVFQTKALSNVSFSLTITFDIVSHLTSPPALYCA